MSSRDARRRALGQNFLVDERAIAAVAGTLHPPPGGLVVDIGAGKGALTRAVAARGARVIALERDPDWVRVLRREAPRWGEVEVVRGDALTFALPHEPHRVVSSVPYGISTQLVRRLLREGHGMERAVVVLQLEAARRLTSGGRFAATWAPWFTFSVGRRIEPCAFRPVPSVRSAIVTIEPRPVPLLSPAVLPAYERFLRTAFDDRRLPPEAWADRFRRSGAPRRAARGRSG